MLANNSWLINFYRILNKLFITPVFCFYQVVFRAAWTANTLPFFKMGNVF